MHLLLDVELKAPMETSRALFSWLWEAPAKVGMTRITEPAVVWRPPLLMGIVILAESHIAVHLNRATKQGHIDCFTCRAFDQAALRADVERELGVRVTRAMLLERGLEYPPQMGWPDGLQL